MRTQKAIKADLAKAQKDIDTMKHIMSNCYSDEGYRNYSRTLDGFIAKHSELEKELAQAKKDQCCGKGPYAD